MELKNQFAIFLIFVKKLSSVDLLLYL